MITVSEEDNFKCELERFGTKHIIDHTRDVLSRDQYRKIKEKRNNPQITIRKADKSNVFVIPNSQYYNDCMEDLVSDEGELIKIDQDTTEVLKKELNNYIAVANRAGDSVRLKKREGH